MERMSLSPGSLSSALRSSTPLVVMTGKVLKLPICKQCRLNARSLESDHMALNLKSDTSQLCDLGQGTSPL